MFDFEKLEVYQVTKAQNIDVVKFLIEENLIDGDLKQRWKSSSLDSVAFLVESTARMAHQDKKNYLINARSSINSCVSLMDMCVHFGWLKEEDYEAFYLRYEQMSKMMLGMIRSFSHDK